MSRKKVAVCLAGAGLLLSLIATVLQIVAVLTELESGFAFFAEGAILPSVAVALACAGGAIGILASCLLPAKAAGDRNGFALPIPDPAAIGFLFFAIFTLIEADSVPAYVSALFSLPAVGFCVVSRFPTLRVGRTVISILGATAAVACAFGSAALYFDVALPMNSPMKQWLQIALLCAMLYYVEEIRFFIGAPLPRLSAGVAFLVCGAAALGGLPTLVGYIGGRLSHRLCLAAAVLILCVSASAILRMVWVFLGFREQRTVAK